MSRPELAVTVGRTLELRFEPSENWSKADGTAVAQTEVVSNLLECAGSESNEGFALNPFKLAWQPGDPIADIRAGTGTRAVGTES